MNLRTLVALVALLAAGTSLASPSYARNGADDPAGHDAGDDHGSGGHGADDPAGPAAADDKGGLGGGSGGSGGSGGGSSSDLRARQDLLRDAASPDADATGTVEVRSRTGREKFKVEADHLAPSASVEVLLEDGSGAMTPAGTAVADALGSAELELDTGDGAVLPAGAATVAELAGRRVEVRDGAGALLLSGTVPSLDGAAAGNLSGTVKVEDPASGLRASARMKVRGKSGRQEFRLDVKGASDGAAVELWIADASGTMVPAATLPSPQGGKSRLRLDSRKGDGMPLSAPGLADLSGRAFELRVDGVTVTSGNLPSL